MPHIVLNMHNIKLCIGCVHRNLLWWHLQTELLCSLVVESTLIPSSRSLPATFIGRASVLSSTGGLGTDTRPLREVPSSQRPASMIISVQPAVRGAICLRRLAAWLAWSYVVPARHATHVAAEAGTGR